MKGGFFKTSTDHGGEEQSFSSNLPVLQEDKPKSKSVILDEATDNRCLIKNRTSSRSA